MRAKGWRQPNKKKKPTPERLRKDGGRGDRKIDSFWALKTGENRLTDDEIIAESESLKMLANKLKQL